METQTVVIWACLVYSVVLLLAFFCLRPKKADKVQAQTDARTFVDQTAAQRDKTTDAFDVGSVVEKAAKLVEALTKAGPAIASLGASIVALGFAAYIVAQPPKDDKTKTGNPNAPQGTTTPPGTNAPQGTTTTPGTNR